MDCQNAGKATKNNENGRSDQSFGLSFSFKIIDKMRREVRIGMVGAGWVTQYHLPAWTRVEGANVVAIADPDIASRQARADALGYRSTMPGWRKCWPPADLTALDIASPRALHAEHVRLGSAAGLHMLCQKPLGVDLAQAETIVRDLPQGVRLMVHENCGSGHIIVACGSGSTRVSSVKWRRCASIFIRAA